MKIDYSALNMDIKNDDIVKFTKTHTDSRSYISNKSALIFSLVMILSYILINLITFFYPNLTYLTYVGYFILFNLVFVLIIHSNQSSYFRKYIKLYNFAESNNLTYIESSRQPDYPGIIFNINRSGTLGDRFVSKSQQMPFEISTYSYLIRSDDNQRLVVYGYVMIDLKRNLPHMILDSHAGESKFFGISQSNLPINFDQDQKLSLEGDFDKYFTLYAPEAYKRDALQIFTPDLMGLFIDESGGFDAEIIDNKLFLYSSSAIDLLNVKLLEKIFNIINTVGQKTISKTEKYHDDAIGNKTVNVIALAGQRLVVKKTSTLLAIFLVIITLIITGLLSVTIVKFLS